jgi:HicB family
MKTVNLILRLPPALHKRLKQQAKRNNVSLNTEIVSHLDEPARRKLLRETMEPIAEAIEERMVKGTGRYPRQQAEIMLDLVLGTRKDSRDPLPTEAELAERLHQIENMPVSTINQLQEIFSERKAAEAAVEKPEHK